MDNLTHGLVGYAMQAMRSRPEVNQHTEKAIFWGSLIGAQGPDIDMAASFLGPLHSMELHRGITHSLPGVLFLTGLIFLGLKWAFPQLRATRIFLFTFLAGVLHVGIDLLTSYGTRFLLPWSDRMYSTDTLFIVDLVIILALVIGLGLKKRGINRTRVFRGVAFFLALYIAGRAYIHSNLVKTVAQAYPEQGALSVLPTPVSLSTWRYVVEREGEIAVGQVNYFRGTLREERRMAVIKDDPVVEAALEAPSARVFAHFARHLWVNYEKQGDHFVVYLSDPRFATRQRAVFGSQVVLDSNLKILSDALNPH